MKSFYKTLAVIAVMTTLITPAFAGATEIKLKSRNDANALKITLRSLYDFEQSLSLKVKTDPRLLPSDVLIKTVRGFNMKDAQNITIKSFDINIDKNVVIGFSGGTSEIINAAAQGKTLHVISSFKDLSGQFVSPLITQLAAYNLQGKKLCFDESVKANPKLAFTLLLDRSGSMYDEMEDVKNAAQNFLNILPSYAQCAVGSFNDSIDYAHKNYQSCSGGGFGFETIQADGGTNILNALSSAYQGLSQPYFKDYQKAVIVITDGYTVNDEDLKAQLLKQKQEQHILTLVYFIGGQEKDALQGITDNFLPQNDVKQSLAQYFDVLSNGYSNQKVLSITPCPQNNQGGVK